MRRNNLTRRSAQSAFFPTLMLVLFLLPGRASGELLPEHVAVVANNTSAESMLVAKNYFEKRRIPEKNIISLSLPLDETISREDYEKKLVLPLRAELEKRKLAGSIRVLVTTFDVPLRVGAPEPIGAEQEANLKAVTQRQIARLALADAAVDASRLLSESPISKPAPELSDEELVKVVDREFRASATRVKELSDTKAQREANDFLGSLVQRVNGAQGIVATLKPAAEGENNVTPFIAELRKQIAGASEMLRALDALPSAENRARAYAVTQGAFGALGVLQRANAEIQAFHYDSADASVDSELSLLWWDRELQPIHDRQPNPLYLEAQRSGQPAPTLPILMVSRLDGPTSTLASRLVDLAIAAERKELKGQVYVDARGMKPGERDSYFTYDQNLRDFGWMVRGETDFDVTIENHEELFESVQDAALYVGWYSVHKFTGLFSFMPGAVGYHIASSEALSVRNANETGWCKNLLERGITATLGAVNEPYLESFPLPMDFFGLLLTGEYSLVETYYLTTRYISWRLALFGDPLYNPFRGRPALKLGQFPVSGFGKDKLPTAPSELPFPDPVAARTKLKQDRKETQVKIDAFFEQLKKRAPATQEPKRTS